MARKKKVLPGERHVDDLMREIGKDTEIGCNDDGSFFAPDGTLWFPAERHGWFFPVAKLSDADVKRVFRRKQ